MHYEWSFERLVRYAARPAVATERLTVLPDGRLLYRLKRSWRDGTSSVIFERQDFMSKLAVLVPAQRAHLIKYHGIFGPAAAWRPRIIPTSHENSSESGPSPAAVPQSSTMPNVKAESASCKPASPRQRNYTWAQLMRRVFLLDVIKCERCGGQMKILAAIHPPDTTAKILECLGLPSRDPPLAPAVSDFNYQMDSF